MTWKTDGTYVKLAEATPIDMISALLRIGDDITVETSTMIIAGPLVKLGDGFLVVGDNVEGDWTIDFNGIESIRRDG